MLVEFVGRVQSILGSDLVGVYLTGSFALGDADAASDCDFLAAIAGEPAAKQERALRELHAEIPTWPGYWAHNLEGSYAPEADLHTLGALGRPWLYVDRGAREMQWSTHCNTADVRWVLREHSATLVGRPSSEFVADVPRDVLSSSMRPRIAAFAEAVLASSFDTSWAQRYAVETSIRILYTLENGEVVSKPSALAWAKRAMPAEWHDLVRQVRRDRSVTWNDPPRAGAAEQTFAFVEYVKQRALA